jgi:hypothetical protein
MALELLGYPFSYTIKDAVISYDEDGFLSNDHIGMLFENETGANAKIYVGLCEKKDNCRIYSVLITEDDGGFGGVAGGVLKVFSTGNIIFEIVVDGVVQGALCDMYNDSFNITPDMYIHIINQKNIQMPVCHNLSKSTGEMPEAC